MIRFKCVHLPTFTKLNKETLRTVLSIKNLKTTCKLYIFQVEKRTPTLGT